ncbi:MAG: SsrA-binding protein SmpB [Schwartzia sp.]|nr:SsrA-binding protein SmpB [Schwartzia sp. (in: firmicutes)]
MNGFSALIRRRNGRTPAGGKGDGNLGKKNETTRTVCENRKARHDYFIHEAYEAGIELFGTEVKSLRAGKANLKDSYGEIKNGQLYLQNMHISPYEQGNIFNRDPLRPKRLLMHKAEIMKLFGRTREKGFTLVPLKVYFKRGRAKVELALASGKHTFDKRRDLAEKAAKREIDRALKDRQRN